MKFCHDKEDFLFYATTYFVLWMLFFNIYGTPHGIGETVRCLVSKVDEIIYDYFVK